MSSQGPQDLLIKAPTDRHIAQLHKDCEALAESVGLFVGTGLRRGDGVVMIISAARAEQYLQRLRQGGIDPEAHRRSGHLTVLDVESVLGRFMREGMPDWADFRQTVGSVIDFARGPGRRATRVFGEIVDILWRQGQMQAAVRLEEYWNKLSRLYRFCLFCGYVLDGLDEHSYDGPLHEIGRTHSDILATEEDERLRAAVDAASKDVFGIPVSMTLSFSGHEENAGEHRLPVGRRTMLGLKTTLPDTSAKVLESARRHYHQDSR